jgi:iron complex outermembrane receptor protein
VAYELGYRGELPTHGLDWEVSLYQQDIAELVAISAPSPLPAANSFDPQSQSYLLGQSRFDNEPATYTARGVELGTHLSPVDRLDLRASAAFQSVTSSHSAGDCGPCTQAPAVKLFAGLSYRSRVAVDFSLDAAYTSATSWIEREPSPVDPTQIANLQNPLPDYLVVNARLGYRLLNDSVKLALIGTQLGPAHAEHPFGNLVEYRVLASLTVTP